MLDVLSQFPFHAKLASIYGVFLHVVVEIYYAKKIYLNYNELHALWIYYAKKKYP